MTWKMLLGGIRQYSKHLLIAALVSTLATIALLMLNGRDADSTCGDLTDDQIKEAVSRDFKKTIESRNVSGQNAERITIAAFDLGNPVYLSRQGENPLWSLSFRATTSSDREEEWIAYLHCDGYVEYSVIGKLLPN